MDRDSESDDSVESGKLETGKGIKRKNQQEENDDGVPVETREAQKKQKIVDFFDIKSTEGKHNKLAHCKICTESSVQTFIKMKNAGTSGLIRHVKAKHNKHYIMLDISNNKNQTTQKTETAISKLFKKVDQTTTGNKGEFNKDHFSDLLIEFIVKKYLPFNFFEDDACSKLFLYLNKNISLPKRNSVRTKILEKFTTMQNTVKNILTIDGWTSISNKSFYDITAHYIDDNWKYQSIVLDFIPSYGKHTGEDIANIFVETLDTFNITNKVQGITTDNAASNFTFLSCLENKLPNFDHENKHFVCFAHIINLAVQNFLHLLRQDDDNNDNYNNTDNSDDEETDDIFVKNVEKNLKTASVITKIRIIAIKIKRSEQLQEKFRICCETANTNMLMPVIDVVTRWNSTLHMLNWALKMRAPLKILCENNVSLNQLNITDDEWELNSLISKYLLPFNTLSTLLCGDKYCTLSMVVVGINLLIDKLETWAIDLDKKINRTSLDEKIINSLQAARDKIVKHYMKTNWIYCIILILDPRHKIEAFDLTPWGKQMKTESIQKFEEIYLNSYYELNEDQNQDQNNTIKEKSFDEFDLDISLIFKSENSTENITGTWKKELDDYYMTQRANENEDVLMWWWKHEKSYPNLAKMAKDFFSTTATSAPAERLFSKASLIIRKHRNRLNPESARSLLCLNSWTSLNVQ